jgi:hypothetical protein
LRIRVAASSEAKRLHCTASNLQQNAHLNSSEE